MKLPEIKLSLTPSTPEAKEYIGFKYADSIIGSRNKIGGSPDFIQESVLWPECCGKAMTFYSQIDSVGDNLCIADCGMIYIFLCFDCFQSHSFVQSY